MRGKPIAQLPNDLSVAAVFADALLIVVSGCEMAEQFLDDLLGGPPRFHWTGADDFEELTDPSAVQWTAGKDLVDGPNLALAHPTHSGSQDLGQGFNNGKDESGTHGSGGSGQVGDVELQFLT